MAVTDPIPNPMVMHDDREQMPLGRRYIIGLVFLLAVLGAIGALWINATR